MYGKNRSHRRNTVRRRLLALAAALTTLCSFLPMRVLALDPETPSGFICGHLHDAGCGFSESGGGTPCEHICNITSFSGNTPGEAVSSYQAVAGETYDEICAALPEALSGTADCCEGDVTIPVRWVCADFTGEAGTYIFRAELTNAHCAYTAVDAPETESIDEGEFPFIEVSVPEAEAAVYSISHDTYPVTVSGSDPLLRGARLTVKAVELSEAQAILGETGAVALFAYDIKIMTGGTLDETTGVYVNEIEYQPTAENPVTVTITTEAPIEAPTVEVMHIVKDTETGVMTPQPVTTVTPRENTVEFTATGFSVYVVTMGTTTPRVSFSYDDDTFDVTYCTTLSGSYAPLANNLSVAAGTELYFTVPVGTVNGVYRDGVLLTDNNGVYALTDITVDTVVHISGGKITFDLNYGSVNLGLDGNYSGYDIAGNAITGTHNDDNTYVVTHSGSDPTNNRVILTGNPTVPKYDVTLSNVDCATADNERSGGIYADAWASTPMEIILRLDGINSVGRVHYATGNFSDSSISSLYITSASGDGSYEGSLIAHSSVTWSAAIGGVDSVTSEASRNITIAGGTITASVSPDIEPAVGTSAIGGGGNGYSDVNITGGSVTATNRGTGATIGGGGGRGSAGGGGYVTISGGEVTATNEYSNGVAIGGGGSVSSRGSEAEVNISGGTVITTGSIGGGSSTDSIGGNAIVNISGGMVTVNAGGNIGGGSSTNSTGGSVTVTITGGTVNAPHISGGGNSDGTYNDATLSIAAASVKIGDSSNINSVTGPDPDTGTPTVVYCQTIDISLLQGFSGGSGSIEVQSASLSDGHDYVLKDVYADAEDKVYFWLPTQYHVTGLTVDDSTYQVTDTSQEQLATITHDSSTVGSELGAALNYGDATGYKWQRSDNGTDNWTDIAVGETYTVVSADINKYIHVVISTANGDFTSGSLRISAAPYARINYTTLTIGSTLTAQLLNAEALSFRWQMRASADFAWGNISNETAETYTVNASDAGKHLRVVIGDGTGSYASSYVVIQPPTFTVIIPESITPESITGSFDITGQRSNFGPANYLTVTVASEGNFRLALADAADNKLNYTLYIDAERQNSVAKDGSGVIGSFSGSGSDTSRIYYSIIDSPLYAGIYTDILTFTATLNG